MTLTPELFVNDNANFNDVEFVIIDGDLTINPKPVELSTLSNSWVYDGKEHSEPDVSGTDGFYARDNISVSATTIVKNVGEEKTNTITVNGDTKNYIVTKSEGTLKINPLKDIVVTIRENSGSVTYNGEDAGEYEQGRK